MRPVPEVTGYCLLYHDDGWSFQVDHVHDNAQEDGGTESEVPSRWTDITTLLLQRWFA